MQSSHWRNLIFRALILSFLTFGASLASAQYYDERPSIFSVEAKDKSNSQNLPTDWKAAGYGQYVLLAELLTFFPESDYYFLARDIEYLHDIASVIFKDDSKMKERIHSVPISRALAQDRHKNELIKYLRQEGLTQEALGGRGAVFIDSCCSGTIPEHIIKTFKTAEPDVSVRGFLIRTDNFPNSLLASSLGAYGLAIEKLPHYTKAADMFETVDGQIRVHAAQAVSSELNRSGAIMQQIRFDYDTEEARIRFNELVMLMRTAYSYFTQNSSYKPATRDQALQALNEMAAKFDLSALKFVYDIKNMARKNYANIDLVRVDEYLSSATSVQKCKAVTRR